MILNSAFELIVALVDGLLHSTSITAIMDAVIQLMNNLVDFITDPSNLAMVINSAIKIVFSLVEGILRSVGEIGVAATKLVISFVSKFKETNWSQIGIQIVSGVWQGIKNSAYTFTANVKSFFSNIVKSAKQVLGIHSPSTVFRDIVGKNIVLGVVEGISKNQSKINSQITTTLMKAKNQSMRAVKTLRFEESGSSAVKRIASAIEKSEGLIENAADNLSSLIVKTMANSKNQTEWSKTATNLSNTFSKSLIENLNSLKTKASEKISEISKEAQKKIDDVLKLRETLQGKLSGFGGLFEEDKDGKITLANLKKQTYQIKSYGKNLQTLSKYFSEGLMSEIVAMNIDDSQKFVKYLSKLDKDELEEYNKLYNRKINAAKKVAKAYYAPYISEVKTEYADKIEGIFKSLNKSLEKIGQDSINGFIKGFTAKNKSAKKEINDFINNLVESVKKQLGIHSPSRVFMDIANQMVNGLVYGWDKSIGTFSDDVTNSLDFGGEYIGSFGGNSVASSVNGASGRPINITQNIYAQKKSAAQLMQEARWQAQMGVLSVV
jgi:hypothetical protein